MASRRPKSTRRFRDIAERLFEFDGSRFSVCNRSPPPQNVGLSRGARGVDLQTAGLAFGGTGLCSYRVRGVDGIRAEHLTVERSYTVFICQQSYLLLFGIPSRTNSFFPGLKPSFSANPSHCSPSFLLLKYLLCGFPGLLYCYF